MPFPRLLNRLVGVLARLAVGVVQALPLRWAAQLGRCGGELSFWFDRRHRRMAIKNLTRCFGSEKSPAEIRALAHENFRRIGENYCCAVKSVAMSEAEMKQVLEVRGGEALKLAEGEESNASRIMATGHFGNFELLMRLSAYFPGFHCAATYRGVRPPSLERLLYALRTHGGGLMFERRTGTDALKRELNKGGLLLMLVSDQSTREYGMILPFLGYDCSVSRAPAIMAVRYGCRLFVPICYRTGLGRWTIEVGEPIPTRANGLRRPTDDITRDINRVFEASVRRDPANWFWVHNRWKTWPAGIATEPAELN
jgi:KDO2-lipid IV(A) lauroyltransferase